MNAIGPLPEAAAQAQLPCEELNRLYGHEGPVLCVRFNTGGNYCLSGGKVGALLFAQTDNTHASGSHRPALEPVSRHAHQDLHRYVAYSCQPPGTVAPGHGYEVRDVATAHDNSKYVDSLLLENA